MIEEEQHQLVCGTCSRLGQAEHEIQTHRIIGERLARLMGIPYEREPSGDARKRYLVPSDTVIGLAEANRLGIAREGDLFGGVVAQPFLATKAITHPLIEPAAAAPEGWSHAFGAATGKVVLDGFTAFSASDARRAGTRLLREGAVRIKRTGGKGGSGQARVSDAAALERALAGIDPGEIASTGIVLEQDLSEVTTFSVGQVQAAGLAISYCGTQQLTEDNRGETVYGGSVLDVVRGGWDALLALPLSDRERIAVAHARRYDEAARSCFPGFFATRRNYDVALGTDSSGRRRCGVLEQSWRLGGATPAEILAIEALKRDPALAGIGASTAEIYGGADAVPPHAVVFFRGDDPEVGPITKIAWLEHGGT
ncbi:DUF3182 family protein [Sphingomonas sp.]|uniref:DUF3182 family protein n=1 Tax=Sphingomonas sp. TaxID=28214 RepID=UPI002DB730A9|nr:DUF3182 family protein [Sphingomonas sp.]HEU4969953.1 DUF3182 family protein [Sphingomonas sp.]